MLFPLARVTKLGVYTNLRVDGPRRRDNAACARDCNAPAALAGPRVEQAGQLERRAEGLTCREGLVRELQGAVRDGEWMCVAPPRTDLRDFSQQECAEHA